MDERQICCCGASGWTKVIGWFQCIGNGFGTAGILLLISKLLWSSATKESDTPEDLQEFTPNGVEGVQTETTLLLIILFVLLFTIGGGFVMAIILLKGTYNKNPSQLSSWRTYACISLAIYILLALGHSLLPYTSVGRNALQLIMAVGVQGFCIWVVGVHREEIMKYGVCGP